MNSSTDLPVLFRMLGTAIMVPTVLFSGPLAGFLLAQWIINQWQLSSKLIIIFVILGLLASSIQTVRLIKNLYKESRSV